MVECCNFSIKIALHRVCFPVNFQKNFRTAFLQKTSGQQPPNNIGPTKKIRRVNDWLKED